MFTTARGGTWRGLLAVAAMIVAVLALAAPAGAGAEDLEAQFVAKINELRASKGLQPLAVDEELTSIGRRWSASMAQAGKISHNPDFAGWVAADWARLGENVGVGPTVESLFDAFVDSPSHYANLVEPSFERIGVGVVLAGNVMYTSHQFMDLRAAKVAAAAPSASRPAAPAAPTTTRRAQTTAATPLPAPRAAAAPAPAAAPSPQLVGVLEQLHHLDQLAA